MWADPLPLTCWRVCKHGAPLASCTGAGGVCAHPDMRAVPVQRTIEQARALGAFCGPEASRMEFKPHATEQAPADPAAHG